MFCLKSCNVSPQMAFISKRLLHPGKAEYETNRPKSVFSISDKTYLHLTRYLNANKRILGKKSGDF